MQEPLQNDIFLLQREFMKPTSNLHPHLIDTCLTVFFFFTIYCSIFSVLQANIGPLSGDPYKEKLRVEILPQRKGIRPLEGAGYLLRFLSKM